MRVVFRVVLRYKIRIMKTGTQSVLVESVVDRSLVSLILFSFFLHAQPRLE